MSFRADRPVSKHNNKDSLSRNESHLFLLKLAHCLHRAERGTLSPAALEYLSFTVFNASSL